MKLAIMQPYFFPYIGYFQLIAGVDKFIIYDDVNYINRGWINRNNILVGGKPCLITLPLKEASQNKKINEIDVIDDQKLIDKLLKTIVANYKRAPYFDAVYDLTTQIFSNSKRSIAEFNLNQLQSICLYLDIRTNIISSSRLYKNSQLRGEDRIIDICTQEAATEYINPIGGMELYNKDLFGKNGIKLFFIKPLLTEYNQFKSPFVPWLSIIDVLMFNSKEQVSYLLKNYEIL